MLAHLLPQAMPRPGPAATRPPRVTTAQLVPTPPHPAVLLRWPAQVPGSRHLLSRPFVLAKRSQGKMTLEYCSGAPQQAADGKTQHVVLPMTTNLRHSPTTAGR